jgi:hypothetical protein
MVMTKKRYIGWTRALLLGVCLAIFGCLSTSGEAGGGGDESDSDYGYYGSGNSYTLSPGTIRLDLFPDVGGGNENNNYYNDDYYYDDTPTVRPANNGETYNSYAARRIIAEMDTDDEPLDSDE